MSDTSFTLIIPAAGTGSRMQKETPKPFLEINGRTILEHTISRFAGFDELVKVVIATSSEFFGFAGRIKKVLRPDVQFEMLEGGSERQDSIYKALRVVDKSAQLVAIHDAVRPFIKPEEILECLNAARRTGAAIVGVPVRDTIKEAGSTGKIINTPPRERLWRAQTPQIFDTGLILEAYKSARENNFFGTDDASLVEALGKDVVIIEGSEENFKITYPLDFQLAAILLNR